MHWKSKYCDIKLQIHDLLQQLSASCTFNAFFMLRSAIEPQQQKRCDRETVNSDAFHVSQSRAAMCVTTT
ncbi:unnamed protein product, partial [Ceratitis capitata]